MLCMYVCVCVCVCVCALHARMHVWLQFADDIAILAEMKKTIVHAMSKLFEITSQRGLTISVPKGMPSPSGARW